MTLIEIFAIIITHFIADFILQDEKWVSSILERIVKNKL